MAKLSFFGLLATTLLLGVGVAAAEPRDRIIEVESVLDRLEKHLLDQEGETLTFGEQGKGKAKQSGPEAEGSETTYIYKKESISGSVPGADKMREIAAAVGILENDVDQLSAEVQKAKQKILEDAKINNFVDIEAKVVDGDNGGVRSMTVKLDGYEIYTFKDSSGAWLPSKVLPIYSGPMQPGNHRLDVEARLVLRSKTPLPMNNDVYRLLNQSFTIVVPDKKFRQRWVLQITAPTKPDEKATTELKEEAASQAPVLAQAVAAEKTEKPDEEEKDDSEEKEAKADEEKPEPKEKDDDGWF